VRVVLGVSQANPKKKKLAEFEAWLDGREQAETAALAKNPSGRPNPAAASAATAGAGAAVPSSAASGGPPKQAGKWWEIPEQTMTRELKRDLQIIHSRNYLDPKRFYKVRRLLPWCPTTMLLCSSGACCDDGVCLLMRRVERQECWVMLPRSR
jgi:hypothetical protein